MSLVRIFIITLRIEHLQAWREVGFFHFDLVRASSKHNVSLCGRSRMTFSRISTHNHCVTKLCFISKHIGIYSKQGNINLAEDLAYRYFLPYSLIYCTNCTWFQGFIRQVWSEPGKSGKIPGGPYGSM